MAASRRTFIALASAGMGLGAGVAGAADVATPATAGGRPLPLLATYVTGTERHDAPGLAAPLVSGQAVSLRREPGNGYDPRAVSVWAQGGEKLGYLPRIHVQALAALMDAGIEARAEITGVRGPRARPDIAVAVAVVLPA